MAIDWDSEVLSAVMAEFGEDQLPTYTPRGLASFALADAVFDREYEQVDVNPQDGTTSTSRRPVLGVRESLFPRPPAQNDTVFIPISGKRYVVRDVQADGHGHSKLMLQEMAA